MEILRKPVDKFDGFRPSGDLNVDKSVDTVDIGGGGK